MSRLWLALCVVARGFQLASEALNTFDVESRAESSSTQLQLMFDMLQHLGGIRDCSPALPITPEPCRFNPPPNSARLSFRRE